MHIRSWHRAFWLSAAPLMALWLTACGGGGGSSGQAEIRLVNLSSSRSTFDLVAVDDDKETTLASSIAADSASDRVSTADGELTYELRRAGNDSAAASVSWSLTDGERYTAIVYGTDSALKIARLDEDEDAPATGKARLRVYNTSAGSGSLDVYVTDDGTALDDASITTTVAANASSGFVTVTPGSYRLRLTAAGDTTDLRLDASALAIASDSVVTLVLTAGEGGVLVHAATLVQDGGLGLHKNSSARVRVASGVSNNAAVGVAIGGQTVVSAQRAPSVSSYRLVNAGSSLPLAVSVDGTALAAQTATLKAGGDYTLVVSGASGAEQAALLTDDNTLPSSGSAGIRLVNAMNADTAGLSLTVDYSVLADGVEPGTASAYVKLSAVTDVPLTVSTPLSTTALLSVAEADLTSQNVYTVFMFGTLDLPYGLLRKDR